MASAKLVRALAEGRVVIQKAPRVGGEVMLSFRPLLNRTTGRMEQPASITMNGFKPVEPLRRSDVTLEHLRNSNLGDLLRRQAIVLL
jgi:hypothetical protein